MHHTTKRAVIIESQRLFMPYLSRAVHASGALVIGTWRSVNAVRLAILRPDVVVLDAAHVDGAPLLAIRTIRAAAPAATIVVCASEDGVWQMLARSVGADVILAASDGGTELSSAVAAGVLRHARGEEDGVSRENAVPVGRTAWFQRPRIE